MNFLTSLLSKNLKITIIASLAAAAKKLGITEAELKNAFGNKMPPDFATAAKNLGMTEAELKSKLGVK